MAYTLPIAIELGAAHAGKTLNAQLVDAAGSNVGAAITTGFYEKSGGIYGLSASVPDGHVGACLIYEEGSPSPVLASCAISLGDALSGDVYARIGVDGSGLTALGDTRIANLDATVGSRSVYAGGAVASVTGDVGGKVLGGGIGVLAAVGVQADLQQVGGVVLDTHTAGLLPADVRNWLGAAPAGLTTNGYVKSALLRWLTDDAGGTPNALQTGRVDSYIGAVADGVIAAASFAANALDAVWSTTARTLTAFGTVASDAATAVWAAGTRTLTAFGFTVAATVADKSGYALTADYDAAMTAAQAGDAMALTSDERTAVADAVWDEALAGHATPGSAGAALAAAGSIGDQWATDLPGQYGEGTAGYILGTNLDAPVSGAATDVELTSATSTILAAIGGLGTGARTITVHVTCAAVNLENARVRFSAGAESYSGDTNASGLIVFALDDATWALAVTKFGYAFTPASVVVTGNATVNVAMTAVTVAPAADPTQCNAYVVTYDGQGTVQPNVGIRFDLVSVPSAWTGKSFSSDYFTETSDADGLLVVALMRLATYKARRGANAAVTFTVPDAATYVLPEVLGSP